ncbi:hypothetical protein ACHAXS_005462, partial [Conticribra weissflogii]
GDGSYNLPALDDDLVTQFCFSDHENFIKLPQLLHSFNHDSHSEQSQQAIKRFHAVRATLETGCDPNAPDSFDKMMLAWDTGASFGLTPFRRDFIDYVEVELPVKDVTKVNKVIGVGTAIFKFKNASGHDIFLPCIAYHLPTADIRLFSPQTYHQMHGGRSEIDADQVIMKLCQETIIIPIERGGCNLSIIYDAAVTEQKQRAIGIQYKTKLAMSGLREMDAMAERAIQTIMYMARTFLIHVSLHWTENGVDDLALWSFAVKHATWLYNRLPNQVLGLTPIELATKTKTDHRDLLRSHVWGCPVFVLEPRLKDGKKIPKWNRHSRQGQFLGFSDKHSSLAANVWNLSTGFISPQFHLVFDDKFKTVVGTAQNDDVVDEICNRLFETNRDWYVEDEYDDDGELIYSAPPLDEVWLTEPEQRQRKEDLARQRDRRAQRERQRRVDKVPVTNDDPNNPPPALLPRNVVSDSDNDSSDGSSVGTLEPEGDDDVQPNFLPPAPNPLPEGETAPRSRRRQWGRDGNGRLR